MSVLGAFVLPLPSSGYGATCSANTAMNNTRTMMIVPINESGSRKMTDNTCRAVRVDSVEGMGVVAIVMVA
jgi:hypothetical protein